MKWKCHFARKQISAYIDSSLSDRRTRSLEMHLSDCADCRLFLEQTRRLDDALLDLSLQQMPSNSDLAARLHQRIAESSQKSVRPVRAVGNTHRPAWTPSYAGLASALVLASGLLVGVILGKQIVAPGLPFIEKTQTHRLDRVAEAVMDVAGYQVVIETSPAARKREGR